MVISEESECPGVERVISSVRVWRLVEGFGRSVERMDSTGH